MAMKKGGQKSARQPPKVIELSDDSYSDDYVEEYNFENEEDDYMDEDENDIDNLDDVKSVITVSSEANDENNEFVLSNRPWRHFSFEQRAEWENMYTKVATPLADGLDMTEAYQREKDAEMALYMEDFPITTWIIPKRLANQAYFHYLERDRWRSLGARIYAHEPTSDWAPGPTGRGEQRGQMFSLPQNIPRAMPMQTGQCTYFPQIPMQQPVHVLPFRHTAPSLPSQYPAYVNGPSNYPQQQAKIGLPAGQYLLHSNQGNVLHVSIPDVSGKSRKPKEKKEHSSPSVPPPTPPYPEAKNPQDHQSTARAAFKSGRRSSRKLLAEEEGFPWTRQIDYRNAKDNAKWDDTIYNPATLAAMAATRVRNKPIISDIDVKIMEQQRKSMRAARAAKKRRTKDDEPEAQESSSGRRTGGRRKRDQKHSPTGQTPSDPYHSGQFCFASTEDETKAKSLGFSSPDEIIDKTESDFSLLDLTGPIKICWNPGKRALAENLEQAVFSIRDTVLTRRQLIEDTPILTRRAAECIIDFCPDMLWRNTLLRIASEAGYGNKDVRDRFCWNGCYCDKATITKRISAALGQKQTQAKSKGYGPGEAEFYNHNVKTFSNYIEFFGKRVGHRNGLKPLPTSTNAAAVNPSSSETENRGKKRKREEDEGNGGKSGGEVKTAAAATAAAAAKKEDEQDDTQKEIKLRELSKEGVRGPRSDDGKIDSKNPITIEHGGDHGHDDGEEGDDDEMIVDYENDDDDDDDAVSLQDSDIFDEMDED